jgi:hypothetical protein
MTNEWIEFRVYLKPGRGFNDLHEAAEQLKDLLSDAVSSPDSPDCFTEDVTYQVVITSKD